MKELNEMLHGIFDVDDNIENTYIEANKQWVQNFVKENPLGKINLKKDVLGRTVEVGDVVLGHYVGCVRPCLVTGVSKNGQYLSLSFKGDGSDCRDRNGELVMNVQTCTVFKLDNKIMSAML